MKPDILYDDNDIIIVSKAAGVLTIPDRFDHEKPSVVGSLSAIYGKVFIVHRIDRETSGILVFAKNEMAHRHLSMQFEAKTTQKIYAALVEGRLQPESGEIDKPIGEHHTIPGKMTIAGNGKRSLTLFKAVEYFKNFTLAEADIKTGRTHQIRVHFASIGFPLAVDSVYGRREKLLLSEIKLKRFNIGKYEAEQPIMQRTTLHAWKLTLEHPTTGEQMAFEAPLPKDFSALLSQLRKWGAA
jgi:23S rRNA pseudouridine1911/1915/1917 synthase